MKPSSQTLDCLSPKVIDMGESYVSSEVRGTFGYVDSEYQSNHRVNSSTDVYSFGIVRLQIVSGKKVINLNLKKPMPLSKMVSHCSIFLLPLLIYL